MPGLQIGMLKFSRNKVVSIERKDEKILIAHGVLEDDIYGLEIEVAINVTKMEIISIEGKWNRQENAECPRAIPFLQEAVGFLMDEGFSQKVKKIIGRKACRHFADILLECCYAAKDAATVIKWENEKSKKPELTFEEFIGEEPGDEDSARFTSSVSSELTEEKKEKKTKEQLKNEISREMIIDLHVHTSPASPCSSAPVNEIIQEAKRIGLDGICLTDHNYFWDSDRIEDLRQRHGFFVFRGNEITTDQGDILVFGFERNVKGIVKLEELREEVLKVGGVMIAAHPFRGFLTFGVGRLGLTPKKAMERPLFRFVDAVEIMNSRVSEKENSFASQVASGLGLWATGGSDAHEVSEVGIFATRFSDSIRDEKDLVQALKNGSYSPIFFRKERGRNRG
ncbi:MAG: PHP domain-containing protein [Pseudomonadota bacterium]